MIEHEGEQYLNAKEAALILNVSRPTFYNHTKDKVRWFELPGRVRRYCRKSEIEQQRTIVEIQPERKEQSHGTYHSA